MPVPKRRTSRTRRDKRRTHKKLSFATVTKCTECGEVVIPHRVCPSCGMYKGRTLLKTSE